MDQRWIVVIATVDGRTLHWRKGGAVHTLSPELGPIWIANFKPALFQVLDDGSIVARGSAGAVDIREVTLETA